MKLRSSSNYSYRGGASKYFKHPSDVCELPTKILTLERLEIGTRSKPRSIIRIQFGTISLQLVRYFGPSLKSSEIGNVVLTAFLRFELRRIRTQMIHFQSEYVLIGEGANATSEQSERVSN